jgi:HEAT repeat protein
MAELEADSEWVADRDERERERQRRVERNRRDEAPLRAALAEQGFKVDSVADLYNQRMNYEAAVPTLLEWFPRVENPAVKESVARALTVRWARPEAAPMMIEELRRLRGSDEEGGLRFAVANALSEVADDEVFSEVVELARDHSYPVADRGVLVLALSNMREQRERAIEVLRTLLEEDVAPHALAALGDLRATEARPEIEPFLEHEESWIRQEAKKALRKLDTVERRS